MTVVTLAEKQTDNRLWTVDQMLADALEHSRGSDYAHGLVLLAGKDGLSNPHWWAANVKVSQMVAMVEAHKFHLLSDLYNDHTERLV